MKPDTESWKQWHAYAADRLRPGFALRTWRRARDAARERPLRFLALSAAVATACLILLVVVHGQVAQAETARNLADWQAIARQARQLTLAP